MYAPKRPSHHAAIARPIHRTNCQNIQHLCHISAPHLRSSEGCLATAVVQSSNYRHALVAGNGQWLATPTSTAHTGNHRVNSICLCMIAGRYAKLQPPWFLIQATTCLQHKSNPQEQRLRCSNCRRRCWCCCCLCCCCTVTPPAPPPPLKP
jgi:hypothetical protein